MPRQFPAPQPPRTLGALHRRVARRVGGGGRRPHRRADALPGTGFRRPNPRIHPLGGLPEIPGRHDPDIQPQPGAARPRGVPARDIRPVALLLARLRRHRHPLRTPAQLPRGARHRARHEPVHARGMQFVRGMGRCERRREAGRRAQLRFLYGRRLHPQQDRDLLPAAGGPSLRQHRLGGDDRRAVGHELRRANRDDQCRERARAARIGDTHLDPRTRDPATCGDHRRGPGDRPPPRHLRQRIAARGLGTRREGGDHRENAPPNRALRGRRGVPHLHEPLPVGGVRRRRGQPREYRHDRQPPSLRPARRAHGGECAPRRPGSGRHAARPARHGRQRHRRGERLFGEPVDRPPLGHIQAGNPANVGLDLAVAGRRLRLLRPRGDPAQPQPRR